MGEYCERLLSFVAAQGIELEFKESISPAMGVSYGGRIALVPGLQPAEAFSVLVHELSHELLHKSERRTATTKTVRETEAEAIAFVVSTTIGLDAGHSSADYISALPRQRRTSSRELGSHSARLSAHSLRHRDSAPVEDAEADTEGELAQAS